MRRLLADRLVFATGAIVILMSALFAVLRVVEGRAHHAVEMNHALDPLALRQEVGRRLERQALGDQPAHAVRALHQERLEQVNGVDVIGSPGVDRAEQRLVLEHHAAEQPVDVE